MIAQTRRPAGAFAKLVRQPGGMTEDEAVRAADANLESIREKLVAEIEATLERMHAVAGALGDAPGAPALEELYKAANSVIGMAGAPSLRTLGQVCHSLCELIDRLQTTGAWNAAAVRLHMDSLRVLRPGTAEDAARQEAIVAALKRVVGRI